MVLPVTHRATCQSTAPRSVQAAPPSFDGFGLERPSTQGSGMAHPRDSHSRYQNHDNAAVGHNESAVRFLRRGRQS